MEKKILIIRSVSFQQLDINLGPLKEMFAAPDTIFYLLTHGHGIERAGQYGLFTEIIDYETRKNFSFFHMPRRLKEERFEAVIVPVTNKSGAGFLNVFLAVLRMKTKEIYGCTPASNIWVISRPQILSRLLKATFFSTFAFVFTLGSLLILPFMILYFLFLRKCRPISPAILF